MEKKIYNKIFWKIFLALLFGFMAIYIYTSNGFYDFEQYKKTELTNDKIEEFEKDIKLGNKIDVKNYIKEEKNYENNFSKAGIIFSNIIEECMENGVKNVFDFLGNVFNE